jgi:hypothetical protein
LTQIKVQDGLLPTSTMVEVRPIMPIFAAKPLDPALLPKTFPFAQALGFPDFQSWKTYLGRFAGGKGGTGVVVAVDRQGYVSGLFCYRVVNGETDSSLLLCDPFLVTDLPRYDPPTQTLLENAERLAAGHGCAWIEIVLPAPCAVSKLRREGCAGALSRQGFAPQSLTWRKRAKFVRSSVAEAHNALAGGER